MDRFSMLAVYLHASFCTKGHKDLLKEGNCDWYYEINDGKNPVTGPELWKRKVHALWYGKAQKVYSQVQQIW